MTKYYFHIRDRQAFIRDDDGMDLRDMDAARCEAHTTAVEWIAANAYSGASIIEITDRDGVVLEALPMRRTLH